MKDEYFYVISKVPSNRLANPSESGRVWYCHRKGHAECPVFESIRSKERAARICRAYNYDGKVHYK